MSRGSSRCLRILIMSDRSLSLLKLLTHNVITWYLGIFTHRALATGMEQRDRRTRRIARETIFHWSVPLIVADTSNDVIWSTLVHQRCLSFQYHRDICNIALRSMEYFLTLIYGLFRSTMSSLSIARGFRECFEFVCLYLGKILFVVSSLSTIQFTSSISHNDNDPLDEAFSIANISENLTLPRYNSTNRPRGSLSISRGNFKTSKLSTRLALREGTRTTGLAPLAVVLLVRTWHSWVWRLIGGAIRWVIGCGWHSAGVRWVPIGETLDRLQYGAHHRRRATSVRRKASPRTSRRDERTRVPRRSETRRNIIVDRPWWTILILSDFKNPR